MPRLPFNQGIDIGDTENIDEGKRMVHAMLGSPQFGSDPLPAQLDPPTLPFVMPLRFWAVPGGIRGQLLGLRITWPREHPRDHKWSLRGK